MLSLEQAINAVLYVLTFWIQDGLGEKAIFGTRLLNCGQNSCCRIMRVVTH